MPEPQIPPLQVSFRAAAGQPFVLAAARAGAAKRFLVPERFTATGASANVGVTMTVETDASGVPRCTALALHELEGGEPITGGTLRRIPVQALMREALAHVAGQVQALPDGGGTRADFGGRPADFERDTQQRRRRTSITDDHLHHVADVYKAALGRREPPTQAVADEMYAARSTAARWVAKARAKDYLGPAVPGRAGERSAS